MNTICQRIMVLAVALAFLGPALRSEQPQKASHLTQEDRIKRLEERADAVEKTASAAATEREFIARTQKVYESFYDKAFNTQLWTLAIVGLFTTVVSNAQDSSVPMPQLTCAMNRPGPRRKRSSN